MANIKFKDARVTLYFKVKTIGEEINLRFKTQPLKGFNSVLEENVLCRRFNVEGNSILYSTLFNKLQDNNSESILDDMLELIFEYSNKDKLNQILLNIVKKQQLGKTIEKVDNSFINSKGNIQSTKKVDEIKDEIKKNKETFRLLLSQRNGDKDLKFQIINLILFSENEKYYQQLLDIKGDKILNILEQSNNEKSKISIHDMYSLQYFKKDKSYDINYIAYSLKFQNVDIEYNENNLVELIKQFEYPDYVDVDNIVGKYIEVIEENNSEQNKQEFIHILLDGKKKLKSNLDNFIPKQKSENYQLYISNKRNMSICIEDKFTGWDDNDLKIHIFGLAMAYKQKYIELSENLSKKIKTSKYEDLEIEAQKLLKFQGIYAFKNPTTYRVYESFYEKLNIQLNENELEKRIESMKSSLRIDYEKQEKKKQDRLNFVAVLFTVFGGIGAMPVIIEFINWLIGFTKH